ncbi:MAG TPA: peptidoglycan DD-metalloendopeptidase family protein [Anaerolineae bacterium]|nr:peptidoglycan DD-metalloendopeptidase family protein [Anaerolineae bacterium]
MKTSSGRGNLVLGRAGRMPGMVLLVLGLSLLLLPRTALAAPDPPIRHAVQPGETVAAIAAQYGSTVPAVVAANLLADPDQIAAGTVLLVPPADYPLVPVDVRPGDTLASLARRYGTKAAELMAINELESPVRLIPGQDLLVPAPAGGRSLALPPGPVVRLTTSPDPLEQGETAGVRVWLDSAEPVSLTIAMDQQVVPLRQAIDGSWWGLLAIAALAEPGYWPLDLHWVDPASGQETTFTWPVQVVDGGYPTYDIELPPGKGDLLAPDLVQAELERLMALWKADETQPVWRGRFIRPISEDYLTSAPYGQRRSYNGGPVSGYHTGQDFAAPEGVPVLAPASGTVVLAEPLDVRGNAVVIDHGAGVFTGYWHLSQIDVQAGQQVKPGDQLGLVGTTGLSTGNHLHWEMRVHGIAVDPLQWTGKVFP